MKEVAIKNLEKNKTEIKLERKIAAYLRRNLSPEEIFEKIKKTSDTKSLSRFLYNSGSYKILFRLSEDLLKNHKPIAWTFVLPLIVKSKVKINKSESKMLYYIWLKDYAKKEPSVFTCRKWEDYSPEFSNLLNIYLENIKERMISEDDKLLETLDFLKAKDLMDEESEIIKILLTKHPENKKYQDLQKSLKERKAIKVIENQKINLYEDRLSNRTRSYFTPEDTEIKRRWSKITLDLSNTIPTQTKNLSLFLYFLGWPDESINVLEGNLKDYSDYWFYLDWLMETAQYTKSLDLTNQLLEQIQDSEMIFSLIYIKSQSLYYLNKKEEAVEHLNSILQIRPDYKSAQSLLDQWTKN